MKGFLVPNREMEARPGGRSWPQSSNTGSAAKAAAASAAGKRNRSMGRFDCIAGSYRWDCAKPGDPIALSTVPGWTLARDAESDASLHRRLEFGLRSEDIPSWYKS